MNVEDRRALLESIISKELDMFLAVRNLGGTSLCQERPESFRLMREISHSVLPDAFLDSYLQDLERAEENTRNLMTEKYALMEGRIPPINDSPLITEIVVSEGEWRKEVASQFPRSIHPDGHESFCLYLGCELQTYSDISLGHYHAAVQVAHQKCANLVRERYELLMKKLGYDNLAHCEKKLSQR
jgi:hypothetical protein